MVFKEKLIPPIVGKILEVNILIAALIAHLDLLSLAKTFESELISTTLK
jgi:hypothetical protein